MGMGIMMTCGREAARSAGGWTNGEVYCKAVEFMRWYCKDGGCITLA